MPGHDGVHFFIYFLFKHIDFPADFLEVAARFVRNDTVPDAAHNLLPQFGQIPQRSRVNANLPGGVALGLNILLQLSAALQKGLDRRQILFREQIPRSQQGSDEFDAIQGRQRNARSSADQFPRLSRFGYRAFDRSEFFHRDQPGDAGPPLVRNGERGQVLLHAFVLQHI
ncbi:hypothetical protein D1872_236900 [compost metagenome]